MARREAGTSRGAAMRVQKHKTRQGCALLPEDRAVFARLSHLMHHRPDGSDFRRPVDYRRLAGGRSGTLYRRPARATRVRE